MKRIIGLSIILFGMFICNSSTTYAYITTQTDESNFAVRLKASTLGGGIEGIMKLNDQAKSAGTYTIGNASYTGSQLGTLDGNVDFNEVSPYIGIGWGTPFNKNNSPWSVNLEIGALYQGSPNVDLNATGPIASDATFQADLAREEDNLEDELDKYQFYPVIALGVSYKF